MNIGLDRDLKNIIVLKIIVLLYFFVETDPLMNR